MKDSDQKARLATLRSAIDRAAQLYYTPGCESPVTDDEFEALIGELRELVPDDPRLTRVGTPFSSDDMREKRTHSIPMGSLDNTDGGLSGFASWYDKTCALLGVDGFDVNASLKMDGNSVALSYVKGEFVEAISRGNGEIGESLTANAVKWAGVPTSLPVPFTGTVRGEAILYKCWFDMMKAADPTLTNPRNVGSGILGRTDGTQNEMIQFVAFNVVSDGLSFPSLNMKFKTLRKLGFTPVQYVVIGGDEAVKSFEDYFSEIEARRPTLPFEIDGVVVMVDDIVMQKQITKDRKDELRPKYGRAVKFVTAKAQTKVKDVTITLGHTGAIIPTAILEPVFVGGVTVTNVLLNNWNPASEYPSAAHVAIGDIVEIARQGDVIPKVVSIIDRPADRQPIEEPKVCPICGSPTTRMLREKMSAVTYCTNLDCAGQSTGKIKHYIGSSDKGVGIVGIGDSVLQALVDAELVSTPADLYRLKAEQLVDLKIGESKTGTPIRLGDSRTASLLAEIEKSKQLQLHKFLGALGISLLGRRRVEIIATEQGLTTLEDWLDEEKLKTAIPSKIMQKSIVEGLAAARPIIDDLLSVGVVVSPIVPIAVVVNEVADETVDGEPKQKQIAGSSFCWTGCRDYIDEVVAKGGVVKSGVSKGLDYLVQKDATSSSGKTLKAESYGTKIISIDCLRAVLDGERELP
jgi:DNA ligase (NAD+)